MTNNYENGARFEEFFSERMRERGFDFKKLSDASGVAVKHLEALSRGNFAALPPEPYFRGYLNRLGQILSFDSDFWWQRLKEGGFTKSSGGADAMPRNRFITKANIKILWIAAIVLVAIIYLAAQLPRILGKPEITISFPQENPATVSAQEIILMGTARNASELYINGELVSLGEEGEWAKVVLLQSELNSFEIKAKKFLGREAVVVQRVLYQPSATSTAP